MTTGSDTLTGQHHSALTLAPYFVHTPLVADPYTSTSQLAEHAGSVHFSVSMTHPDPLHAWPGWSGKTAGGAGGGAGVGAGVGIIGGAGPPPQTHTALVTWSASNHADAGMPQFFPCSGGPRSGEVWQ